MKKNKSVLVLLLAILGTSLAGCSAVMEQEQVEVPVEQYTADVLPDGIYVKAGDLFYKPYDGDKTYTNLPENTSTDRILWYTDNKIHIPDYRNGNQIIYKNSSSIPTQFVVEGFEHVCDSFGIRGIRLDDSGRYVIGGEYCLQQASDAYMKLMPYLNMGTIILDSLNNTKIQNRMVNKTGSLSGLEKGEAYMLGFYIGTQYYEETILADTEIYCSKNINTITQYDMTKNGYLILHMPDLMTPGLYDLNGIGVVHYSGVIQE